MTGLLKAYVAIITFSRRIDKRFANFFQSSLILSIACTFARILYVPKRFSSIFRPRFPTQRPLFCPFASAKTARSPQSLNRIPSMRTALIFLKRSALFTVFALLVSVSYVPVSSVHRRPVERHPFPRSAVRPAQSLRSGRQEKSGGTRRRPPCAYNGVRHLPNLLPEDFYVRYELLFLRLPVPARRREFVFHRLLLLLRKNAPPHRYFLAHVLVLLVLPLLLQRL